MSSVTRDGDAGRTLSLTEMATLLQLPKDQTDRSRHRRPDGALKVSSWARRLSVQGEFMARELCYLGMSAHGELQIASLQRFETAAEVVAALDTTHLMAIMALGALSTKAAAEAWVS